jgi:2'-5' RNA ligase
MTEHVLGVVVDIPAVHAEPLARWRRRVGDPFGDVIPPHVTLLPATPRAGDLEPVYEHLDRASAGSAPFPMHLSGTGTFRPVSDVVFVQVARGIGECEVLSEAIRSGPLARGLDHPYHPHVTVAQDVSAAGLDAAYDGLSTFTARFLVEAFTLYRQATDGSWSRLRTFPLTARLAGQ